MKEKPKGKSPRAKGGSVRRRERAAFEAGWRAGAYRVNDMQHGYSHLSINLGEAWTHYMCKTATPNDPDQRPGANKKGL